jgi:ubiquinone/menaquinone biosynthesis C-methylase UbiE
MAPPLAPADVTRTVAEAREGYDRIAGIYDVVAGSSERPWRRRALALLALAPGERVLEIGCGTGEALLELAGVTEQAVGLDLSPGMLRQARARLDAREARAHLVQADAHRLPFKQHSHDALFMSFVLDLVASREPAGHVPLRVVAPALPGRGGLPADSPARRARGRWLRGVGARAGDHVGPGRRLRPRQVNSG